MATKLSNKNLHRAGGASYGITLPIALVRELGWKERQKVVVTKRGTKLVVEDWKK